MKSTKVLLAAAALALSFGAYSQTESLKKDSIEQRIDTTTKRQAIEGTGNSLQDVQSTTTNKATSDTTNNNVTNNAATTTSLAASDAFASVPKPNFGRYYIPALGSYNAVTTSTDNKSIKITPDENNPGKIWVEGLTDTKFYALLKALPGTYKVPAQKQDDKSVAEGTLIYDENSKQISICTGCGYNEQAPAVVDATVATTEPAVTPKDKKHHKQIQIVKKTPVISFTGTKADQGTVSILQ